MATPAPILAVELAIKAAQTDFQTRAKPVCFKFVLLEVFAASCLMRIAHKSSLF